MPSGNTETEAPLPHQVAEEVRQVVAAKEAAEAASRAKSEFLAFFSHEIRNPLSNLLGTIELMRDTELSAEQRRCLAMAESSLDVLLTVTNDILDLSKIEAGRMDVRHTPFVLRDQLEMALEAITPGATAKNLRLRLDVESAVPPVVFGDPGRLRQVLDNLLTNALKFTLAGEIRMSVDVQRRDGPRILLHFSVADTGIGIPEHKRLSVFQPFEQAERSTRRQYGGAGLGLAICENLVRIMGGRIWLDHEAGFSSVFHFTAAFEVPAVPPPHVLTRREEGSVADVAKLHADRPLRILLVEDEAVGREVVAGLLARRGHVIHSVENGREAVRAFEQAEGPFDLVLMDIMMPEEDGLKAAAEIRVLEQAAGRRAPIVAMTASAMRGDRERCLAAGMDAYLAKPVQRQELIDLVESIASSPDDMDLCNVEQLRDWCAGDQRLLEEVVRGFLQTYRTLLPQLREALESGQSQVLLEGSHRLAGLAGNLRAPAMLRAAHHLERLARDGQLDLAPAGIDQLESEYARLASLLTALLPAHQPRSL